jgi:hypothetical protein
MSATMGALRAFALLLVLGLAACKPQAPAPSPAFDAKASLAAYLTGIYGPAAARGEPWTDGADDRRVERSVCAFGPMQGDPRGHYLLAVCGEWLAGGHASPGVIDFHQLEPTVEGFRPTATARDQGFGSDGHPGTVSLVRLGRERGGFLVEESWVGQGYVFGTRSLVEFRDGALRTLAAVRSGISNAGSIDCFEVPDCGGAGFEIEFAQSLDASAPAADAYPLLVHETGHECGADVDRRHRFAFDAASARYPVPDALMREDCLQESATATGAKTP